MTGLPGEISVARQHLLRGQPSKRAIMCFLFSLLPPCVGPPPACLYPYFSQSNYLPFLPLSHSYACQNQRARDSSKHHHTFVTSLTLDNLR